jgi:uncharacterized protein (DUF2141 family)
VSALTTPMMLLLTVVLVAAQGDLTSAVGEGTVKNLKTGEAIADVRVSLTPDPTAGISPNPGIVTKSGATDANGKFTITGVAPGRYAVAATRTLFFRPRRDTGPTVLTLTAGQRISGVQILLSPTGVVAGRVIDDKREPLRSVRVEAVRREFREGQRVWVSSATSTTDDRGEYRLFNLAPGNYYVRATQGNSPPLYYPGSPDSQAAVSVSVEQGSDAGGIDVEMRRMPEYSVQLKLGGVPAGSQANFQIRRKNGLANELQLGRPENLANDTYRLGQLTPGSYDIQVQVYTPGGIQPRALTHAATIPVNVGNANQDLGTVAVPATVSVTGRIRVPDPLPSPLALERLTLFLRSLDLPLNPAGSVRGNTTPPGFAPDGSFTLSGLAAGRYQIQLTGLPADTFVISARERTREVLDTGFTVTGTQNALELTVGGPGSVGTVIGTVVNALGNPLTSSTVVLVPPPERRSNPAAFRTATTDQSGAFSIRSVLAGDYRILAWEDLEAGAYMDPEFLKDFETRGELLRVQRGSQSNVVVRGMP